MAMKDFIRGMVVFSALAGAISLSAQTANPSAQSDTSGAQTASLTTPTADEIVQNYVSAIGGKEAISKVKSISMESSAQIMGNDAPSTTAILDGVGYKSETDFNGNKIVSCYTDKGGWSINPMTGVSDPAPMPDDQYKMGKAQIYVGGALYGYAAKGSKVELLGKDANTYKIKLTSKDNVDFVYVIDAATWLVKSINAKGKMQDQDVDITTSFSDYRKTDVGYLVPYSIDVDFGGQFQLSIAVKKVELNKTIDPAIFAMPKADASEPATTGKPQ
jgi:hypothetical protein